jgi:hypothetical protein
MGNVLSIDIGYGFTKTFQTGVGKGIFPTWIAASRGEWVGFGERQQEIRVNNKSFYVGHDAEGADIQTLTTSFVGSDAWLAVIGKVLTVNNVSPKDLTNMRIVLGLPPGIFRQKEVARLQSLISDAQIQCDGQTYDFRSVDVKMIPQGAGIYYAYLTGNPERESVVKKAVAVIDIGHYTVDTVLFSPGGKYNSSVQKSVPLGISLLLHQVIMNFNQEHKKYITNEMALQLLKTGKVGIAQEEYTLESLAQAEEIYAMRLNAYIEKFFDSDGLHADLGLAAGGGILQAIKYLKATRKKVLVMAEPDMANVIGYWHYGNFRN